MAGFQPTQVNKNKIEIEDFDDEMFVEVDTDIEDDEDIEERPTSKKESSNKGTGQKKKQNKIVREPSTKKKKSKKEDTTQKAVMIGGIAVVVIVALIFVGGKLGKKEEEVIEDPSLVTQQQNITTENLKPGVPNMTGTGAEQNDTKLSDPTLITKDLNGNVVGPDYKIVNNETLTDFISYTKYRAPMGSGVELYWLEAEYKGQPYKVTVPYSVYSKLDESGITVVDMEVLTLEGGAKMITYMNVRKDAKALLDKNR